MDSNGPALAYVYGHVDEPDAGSASVVRPFGTRVVAAPNSRTLAIRQKSQQDFFLGAHCLSTNLRQLQVLARPSPFASICREFPHLDNSRHVGRIRECAASKNCKSGVG